jgi:Flp pilus assembly protein CpaB
MITVVKARSQLPGGTVVSAADLVLDRVAASDIPEGALTDPDALIGKTLAAPVAENQILTPLTASVVRTSVSPGHVIAPLRLADTALGALIRPGDVVDVIAANTQAEQAVVVAAGARVVTIPDLPDDRAGPGPDGALVLIDVDAQTASIVAQAAASSTLSVIWR